MLPQPYNQMPDYALLALAVYREARGEPMSGKKGVAHVIRNRTLQPGWWGTDWKSVILKPWQFSSFNPNDPNNNVWPSDGEQAWTDCLSATSAVMFGDETDLTDGACWYHDVSMGWPEAWGNQEDYMQTLAVGRLLFYRLLPPKPQQQPNPCA